MGLDGGVFADFEIKKDKRDKSRKQLFNYSIIQLFNYSVIFLFCIKKSCIFAAVKIYRANRDDNEKPHSKKRIL